MNYQSFYYDRLTKEQQILYLAIKDWFSQGKTLPFEVQLTSKRQDDLKKSYEALFLDDCDSKLPPIREILFMTYSDRGVIFLKNKSEYTPFTSSELEMAEEIIKKAREHILTSDDIYRRVISATRFLHSKGVYLLNIKINGEAPANLLLYRSAYCIGIARTVKALVNDGGENGVICVRGNLKKEFSSLIMSGGGDIPHMWNGFFDEKIGEWVFFDPTTVMRVANKTSIEQDIISGKYRNDYANGTYKNIKFYTLKGIQRKYILEDDLWKT